MVLGAILAISSIAVTVEARGRDPRRRVPAVDRRAEDAGGLAGTAPAAPAATGSPLGGSTRVGGPAPTAGAAPPASGGGLLGFGPEAPEPGTHPAAEPPLEEEDSQTT